MLCEDGLIGRSGGCGSSAALGGDVDELDGRGPRAIPGLVDCHTHALLRRRPRRTSSRCAPAARATRSSTLPGGGILSTVRATRGPGEDGLARAVRRHRDWMLPRARRPSRAKSGYGLDRETELASLRRSGGGRRPDLARRARGSAGVRRRRRVPRLRARRGPAGGGGDRGGGRRLPRARRVRRGAGAPLPRGVSRGGLALRLHGDQFTESGGDPARDRARRALASTTSRRPATTASRALAAATSSASCSRRARCSSAGRCRPPARSSTPAPRSPSRPTSTPGARSARACRSSARSRARSFASRRPRRSRRAR